MKSCWRVGRVPVRVGVGDEDVEVEVREGALDRLDEVREGGGELVLVRLHVAVARDDEEEVHVPERVVEAEAEAILVEAEVEAAVVEVFALARTTSVRPGARRLAHSSPSSSSRARSSTWSTSSRRGASPSRSSRGRGFSPSHAIRRRSREPMCASSWGEMAVIPGPRSRVRVQRGRSAARYRALTRGPARWAPRRQRSCP